MAYNDNTNQESKFSSQRIHTSTAIALTSILSCIATPSALADITGFVYQDIHYVDVADGFGAPDFSGTVIDLWMEFDDAADVLLNVMNVNDVNLGVTYYQSFTGAAWSPNNLGPPNDTMALQYADSFVSIGGFNNGSQSAPNGTGLDPNFGGEEASGPNSNAGWYNFNAAFGAVVETPHTSTGLGVFIGRFSMNGSSLNMGGSIGEARWNQGLGTGGEQGSWIIVSPDECTGDLDGSGTVEAGDLGLMLAAWGTDDPIIDFDGSGIVDGADLAIVLASWGPCM